LALYRRAPDAPWLAGAVLAARGIGAMIGTIGLGSFLDRWDRRRTLVTVNLLLALLTVLLPALTSSPAILFVIVSFLIGVLGSVPQPALSASLPSFAPLERSHQVQALFNLTWMSAELLAPALAGFLIASISAVNVLYVDALSFLIVWRVAGSVRFACLDDHTRRGFLEPEHWRLYQVVFKTGGILLDPEGST
jgi:MFS family permease